MQRQMVCIDIGFISILSTFTRENDNYAGVTESVKSMQDLCHPLPTHTTRREMWCWIRISGQNFHLGHAFWWKLIFVNLRRRICVNLGGQKTDFGPFGYHPKQRNFVQVMVQRLFFLLKMKIYKLEIFWDWDHGIKLLSYELLISVLQRTKIGLIQRTTHSSNGTATTPISEVTLE